MIKSKILDHFSNGIARLFYIIVAIAFSAGLIWSELIAAIDMNARSIKDTQIFLRDFQTSHKINEEELLQSRLHRTDEDLHMPYREKTELFVPRVELEKRIESLEKQIGNMDSRIQQNFADLKDFIKEVNN